MDSALDSLNDSLREQVINICGNDVNCLYDAAVTRNLAIGLDTLNQETAIQNEIVQLGKFSEKFRSIKYLVWEIVSSAISIKYARGRFSKTIQIARARKTSAFVQITRQTILLLVINLDEEKTLRL